MVCDKVLGILEKHSIGIFKKVRVKQFSNFIELYLLRFVEGGIKEH